MKHIATLSDDLWRRCNAYGKQTVAAYASGLNPRSRALVIGDRPPIHDNPKVQAWGKAFECALCLWAGEDIERLNWSVWADDGTDIVSWDRRIDVKGSPDPRAKALIWPVSKNRIFNGASFDTLVFCRRADNHMPIRIEIVGWLTKDEFRSRRQTAVEGNRRKFTAGTWYVNERNLNSPASLLHWQREAGGAAKIIQHITPQHAGEDDHRKTPA